MKNKLTIAIALALLGLLCWAILIKVSKSVAPSSQNTTEAKQLQMEWREVVAEGVSSDEKDRIVAFVDTFERAITKRDSDKVLNFFSAPETDAQQNELNFILGADLAQVSATSSARLFTTTGYNFDLVAHYVRNVSAQGEDRRVIVDEMRIIRSGGEWVGTVANVSRLVVELRATSHGYEIVRYYHEGKDGKYEGFIAE